MLSVKSSTIIVRHMQLIYIIRSCVTKRLSQRERLLGKRGRAAEIRDVSVGELASDEAESVDSWRKNTVEVRWDTLSEDLVEQARGDLGVDGRADGAVGDETAPALEGVEAAAGGVATEEDGVEEVHLENLGADELVGVWLDTVGPVVWDLLLAGEGVGTVIVLLGAEEGGNGVVVWGVAAGAGWHELVQERGSAEEQQAQRAEVEVGVLIDGLLVALVAVQSKVGKVVVAASGLGHHAEEGAVELEVVTTVGKVIVTGERGVSLELVVAIKTWLAASQDWVGRSAAGGVASDRKLLGDEIAVGQGQTEKGEEVGKIVANVVDVLLSVDELVVSDNTIVCQKVVVGSDVPGSKLASCVWVFVKR